MAFPTTPTALKILAGNPGKRPLPIGEPQPEREAPPCPRDLPKEARRQWKRLAPILGRMRVLTEADGLALEHLVRDLAQEREVTAELLRTKLLISQKGYVQINPLFHLQSELWKRISDGLREFGLTPAARTRICVHTARRKDPKDNVLNGNWKATA
jgi:P27 family predicted phage terminase small subunit